MHIRLLAVGDRQPSWVDDAFDAYVARYPREWKFRLDTLATVRRARNDRSQAAREAEGKSIISRLGQDEQVVLLDEEGSNLTSRSLAAKLAGWQSDGRNLSFIIGGPDGVSAAVKKRSDMLWSLSSLTLPHGLARVLFAEQMYRAHTMQTGHPYHRA